MERYNLLHLMKKLFIQLLNRIYINTFTQNLILILQNSLDERISNRDYAVDFEDPTPQKLLRVKEGLKFEQFCRKVVLLALMAIYIYTKYYFITSAMRKFDTRPEGFNNDLYQWFAFKNSTGFYMNQALPSWLSKS